ncbi:MAG: AAA family ATPase [Deltaproteobacteria bacterium]|nr:AAA family ATPase [Deltaproteobacteria bacterium]
MYAHFYRLSEDPFNLTPDPRFHYVNSITREALASVLYGIRARKGCISLVGEAGTGKTTLLKRVAEELQDESTVVFIFNPGVSFDELLEYICMELGLDVEGCARLGMLDRLNGFLLESLVEGRNVVVLIDEAQTLPNAVLEGLRLLTNLETSKEKTLQIVLSGQPELEEKLRDPSLRQLRQRIGTRARLEPLRQSEIGAYVTTRLRGAGGKEPGVFSSTALRLVWMASAGIPRLVNVVCDNALLIAFAAGRKRVGCRLMNEAVRDVEGSSGLGSWAAIVRMRCAMGHKGRRVAVAAVAASLVLGLAWANVAGQAADEPAYRALADTGQERALAVPSAPVAEALSFVAEKSFPPAAAVVSRVEEVDTRSAVATSETREPPVLTGSGVARPVIEATAAEALGAAAAATALASKPSAELLDGVSASTRLAAILARSTAARLYDTSRPAKPALYITAGAGVAAGRDVLVKNGDTIWDIAEAAYGNTSPATLDRIFEANPELGNPRKLAVGGTLFLPFNDARAMVSAGNSGGWQVLLVASGSFERLDGMRDLVSSQEAGVSLKTRRLEDGRGVGLFAVGFGDRDSALRVAGLVVNSAVHEASLAPARQLATDESPALIPGA